MLLRRLSTHRITHASCKQPVGRGWEVAQNLGARSTSFADPHTKRGGLDGMTLVLSLLLTTTIGGVGYFTMTDRGNKLLKELRIPGGGLVEEYLIRPFTDSVSDRLLPDFPPLERDQITPKTLVVDFEDTLAHLEWDQKYGWRAVKRPGVDQFLMRAASSGYEIVLFSTGMSHFLEPFAYSIDPRVLISHRLYRESTVFMGNKHVKDLSKLNRELKNVIVIDDDPKCIELQPENLICVKPFVDKNDLTDSTLLDLTVLLEDMARREVDDVRTELERLRALGCGDAVAGFKADRQERMRKAEAAQQKGIGGMMRAGLGRRH